jgi:hypothetical protein
MVAHPDITPKRDYFRIGGYSTAIHRASDKDRNPCEIDLFRQDNGTCMTNCDRIKFSAAIIFLALSLGATYLSSQDSPPKLSLVISAPQSVAIDSTLSIEISIRNVSADTLDLTFGRHGNLPDGYKYIVRDEKGNLIPEDPFCSRPIPDGTLRLPCRAPGSIRRGGLRPAETSTTAAQLTDLYRFSRPGRYTIQVSRQPAGMPIVYSNVLSLAVLAKP